MGDANNPNWATLLTHQTSVNSTNKVCSPPTGTKKITKDAQSFPGATLIIATTADDIQSDDPDTPESGNFDFNRVAEHRET